MVVEVFIYLMTVSQTSSELATSGVRFTLLSGISFATTLVVTAAAHEVFGVQEEIAYLIALAVALHQNFLGMRYYVCPGSSVHIIKQYQQFLAASIIFRGLEYIFFIALHTVAGVNYLIATVLVMLVSFVSKFIYYRSNIFR